MWDQNTPLAELIRRHAREQGLTRKEIALRLGYKNRNKGFTRLDQLLRCGRSSPDLLKRLGLIFPFDAAELADAVALTSSMLQVRAERFARQKHEETQQAIVQERVLARRHFTPHLWVIPERKIPSPIFVLAVFGEERFRRVNLPDGILTLSENLQKTIISRAASFHFTSTGGQAGPFGKILGYLYRRSFDQSWRLSVKGDVLNRDGGSVPIGNHALSLKGKRKKDLSILFK